MDYEKALVKIKVLVEDYLLYLCEEDLDDINEKRSDLIYELTKILNDVQLPDRELLLERNNFERIKRIDKEFNDKILEINIEKKGSSAGYIKAKKSLKRLKERLT
jgi:hypothetical protein